MTHRDRPYAVEYIPGIDGLRAIAVIAVVLFHIGAPISSGFVGVDVFFVISGYVVSWAGASLDKTTFGRFITGFYARRMLRILPALLAFLLCTALVAVFIVPDGGWLSDSNRNTGLAAFFGLSNVMLTLTANDYWSPRTEFNPFTHSWSLGVEEQFYLIFPFLYFLWARGRRQLGVAATVAAGLLSLGVAVLWAHQGKNVAAFYLLPARFWELALGATLYFARDSWRPWLSSRSRTANEALAAVAILAVLASCMLVDSASFPWPWALLPAAATALALACVTASPTTAVARLLASAPAVAIGKRSYSLYLWHWPVIVFLRWTVGMESVAAKLAAGITGFTLAALSYSLLEVPLRRRAFANRSRLQVVAGFSVVVVMAAGVSFALSKSTPWLSWSVTRDSMVWSSNADVTSPVATCTLALKKSGYEGGGLTQLQGSGCGNEARTLFVAGDSHAGAYMPLVKRYALDTGAPVQMFVNAGCTFIGLRAPIASEAPDCTRFIQAVLKKTAETGRAGDVVFLPSLRLRRFSDQWGGANAAPAPENRAEALAEAVALLRPLTDRGIRIVFEAPKPLFRAPPFRCADWFNRDNTICRPGFTESRSALESLRSPVLDAMHQVAQALPGVQVWDPVPLLCDAEICAAFRGRTPLFFDGDHLSAFGNAVLVPSFERAIAAARPARS